jgi:hypothetical protein
MNNILRVYPHNVKQTAVGAGELKIGNIILIKDGVQVYGWKVVNILPDKNPNKVQVFFSHFADDRDFATQAVSTKQSRKKVFNVLEGRHHDRSP